MVNDKDALAFEQALDNCTAALRECVSCSGNRRPPPPFDVTFRRGVTLTVPEGVAVVSLEVAGAGGGHSISANPGPATAPGGHSSCAVAGVNLTASGGASATGSTDGTDGSAVMIDAFSLATATFVVTGAGAPGGVSAAASNGGRGGNGGLAGAHVAVSAGQAIVCTVGMRGANQVGDVAGQDSTDGWVRIRW